MNRVINSEACILELQKLTYQLIQRVNYLEQKMVESEKCYETLNFCNDVLTSQLKEYVILKEKIKNEKV